MQRLTDIAAEPPTVTQVEDFVLEALRLAAAGCVSNNERSALRWMTHRRLWLANTVMRPRAPARPVAAP